mgnify:FL=1|tara:strand:- start:572 stop:844 length:273 start_codon:yes stop_codon:yes gene_type:complete
MSKAQNIMRKIYDTYATYGIYAVEGQRADAYHDHMLYSYERAKSLYEEAEGCVDDEYSMDELLDALNDELKYINHFKKIHILLATIPSHV